MYGKFEKTKQHQHGADRDEIMRSKTGTYGRVCICFVLILQILFIGLQIRMARDGKRKKEQISQSTLETAKSRAKVHKILLYTYMRGGSSFTGQMFDGNPASFYMFEPLDGVYSYMYSTTQKIWHPLDIYFYPNGSRRTIQQDERHTVLRSLTSIYSCDLQALPTEVLVHPFMALRDHGISHSPYKTCIRRNSQKIDGYRMQFTYKNMTRCKECLDAMCPPKFQEYITKFCADMGEQCRKNLTLCSMFAQQVAKYRDNTAVSAKPEDILQIIPRNMNVSCFVKAEKCMHKFKDTAEYCYDTLKNICTQSRIRVVKAIRLSMDTVEHLLEEDSDVKVIHVVRDPRAIAMSRLNLDVLSRFISQRQLLNEAEHLCRKISEDLHIKVKLKEKYPNRIIEVKYEELAKSPIKVMNRIYGQLGINIPEELYTHFFKITHTERQGGPPGLSVHKISATVVDRWRARAKPAIVSSLTSVCHDVLESLGYVNHQGS